LSALLASHLLPALQLHLLPKSALDVHLLILESDILPNVLSAGLTVASAAIADAGIPMYSLGVGATVSKADQTICVDPETEEEEGTATVAVGVLPALQKLSGVLLTGDVDVDEACQVGTWNHYN
jgi:exosome complex component MTR3